MKCKSEGRELHSTLHKYNHLMVIVERNWRSIGKDDTILVSFWDLRGEPCILKEKNLIDLIPSETLSENELGEGCRGEIYEIDIKLSREIMAIYLVIKIVHPKQERYQFITLLYSINTTQPSQDPDVLHFVKNVKLVENSRRSFFWPHIYINEKYLIFSTFVNDEKLALEVHEIQTLLSALDTRLAPRKVLPRLNGTYVLEPGMSDRLAVFNKWENRLTILDLVSTNPITIVDTIEWSILGQPSEKYDLPDKKLKIYNIDGNWCCGSFLILQRLELPNKRKQHRQWVFKLSLVDPGTVEKRPEVISQIKEIFDSKISYPGEIEDETCYIDVMGIVYVVSDTSGDVDYLTVNCAQFHNINAAQRGCNESLEDSSSDILGESNVKAKVVNWMEKGEEGKGEEDEKYIKGEEETGKEKGDAFYPGFFLIYFFTEMHYQHDYARLKGHSYEINPT